MIKEMTLEQLCNTPLWLSGNEVAARVGACKATVNNHATKTDFLTGYAYGKSGRKDKFYFLPEDVEMYERLWKSGFLPQNHQRNKGKQKRPTNNG